jgi:hypothetical protein
LDGKDHFSINTALLTNGAMQVLHLNIPAPNAGFWTLIFRKVGYVIPTLLFPEIVFAVSFFQLFKSYSATNAMNSRRHKDWAMGHSFYENMGGYVLHHRDKTPIPLVMSEMISLLDANLTNDSPYFQLPELSSEYIMRG